MSVEQNKALVREMVEEIFNRGNVSLADKFLAPDYVDRAENLPGMPRGREGVIQMVPMLHSTFPDLKITMDDIVAEGDEVVMRGTCSGTHKGEFMGIPPTG